MTPLRLALLLAITTPLTLVGCGGGSGGGDSGGDSNSDGSSNNGAGSVAGDGLGEFSLDITDAPVDDASKVIVEFTGVSIKPAEGEALRFDFPAPIAIDLLSLQGSSSAELLDAVEVPADNYEWVRLEANASLDGTLDSYVEMKDGSQQELWLPGNNPELKLVSGFTVPDTGSADFTVDFDLRKSLNSNPGRGGVMMKPVMRLVSNETAREIEGQVAGELIAAQCADASLDDGAVYVFSGETTPQDLQGNDGDPVLTALVKADDGEFEFELGFLEPGTYTLSYTCDASSDDPEAADELTFAGTEVVNIEAGDAEFILDGSEDDSNVGQQDDDTEDEAAGDDSSSDDDSSDDSSSDDGSNSDDPTAGNGDASSDNDSVSEDSSTDDGDASSDDNSNAQDPTTGDSGPSDGSSGENGESSTDAGSSAG
ncbi:hypothetical protein CHH28_08160 [Bacterioplanes sanyensis]|uniref:DUF4382 domain-containing protein n=1 Tax=Bacterioplanes sanyensis TaxID=1249553 RepID=A0A222FJ31_9GAMM|nr:DUF4382 domain-containing protein [Bacterioplanes sanyensis]ASP38652.1 hypothetical protein CHH28_08160 [Bacterioplanes sanyensis]